MKRAPDDHTHDKRPAYSALSASFNGGLAMFATGSAARGRFADGVPWQDLLLLGMATHKVSRILAKDRVMEPIRSVVVKEGPRGKPAGGGMRRALGELVTCPYCTAPWLSLAFTTAYAHRPAETRAASAVLGVVAVSDFLNRCYSRLSGS